MAVVVSNHKWGILRFGKELIHPIYDSIYCEAAQEQAWTVVLPFKMKGKWGLVDAETGKEAVKAEYEGFTFYKYEAMVITRIGTKRGCLSVDSHSSLAAEYDSIGFIPAAYDGVNGHMLYQPTRIVWVERDHKWGMYSLERKMNILPCSYDDIRFPTGTRGDDQERRWTGLVKQNNLWAIFDSQLEGMAKGILRTQVLFADLEPSPFGCYRFTYTQNAKWGLVNSVGKIVLSPKYDSINDEIVQVGPRYGIIAMVEKGAVAEIVKPEMDEIVDLDECGVDHKVNYRLRQDGKYGFVHISQIGDLIKSAFVKPQYDSLTCFAEFSSVNYLGIRIGSKWGLITIQGQSLIPCSYDEIGEIHHRIANVRVGEEWRKYQLNQSR